MLGIKSNHRRLKALALLETLSEPKVLSKIINEQKINIQKILKQAKEKEKELQKILLKSIYFLKENQNCLVKNLLK